MKIFPKEILEYTTQYFIPKNSVRSKAIYGVFILLIIVGLSSMPFIMIPIYSSARGFIKPNIERVAITSINSGKVISSQLENGKEISKGDTLLILENSVLDEQLNHSESRIAQINLELSDLKYLITTKVPNLKKLSTPKFQKELIQYQSKVSGHYTKIKKLKDDFKRNKLLFSKGVIAQVEFEEVKLNYDLSENALYQFQKQQINTWQANLTELSNTVEELKNRIQQVQSDKKNYVISSPITGMILTKSGVQIGSFINAGAVLGEITPDTELIAECYVSPSDIGLIDESKEVKFQIDAFNYNQWGFAHGNIISVSKDVEFIDNQPVYRIQCLLKEKSLTLKNGYKGEIGKGMTFNARFNLTERTLYQLLYDKMDDWFNPGNNNSIASN